MRRSSASERARILRAAMNVNGRFIDVLVRLQSAQMALRSAKDCADEVKDRPAVSQRLADIIEQVDSLIEGLR